MAEFGELLRKARQEKGYTQQSLAEKVYVTRQTISRWEGGERYPDLITLKKISSVLEVGIDELLDNKEVTEVVEKNPIIEKPIINNMMVILYALVAFTYLVLGINNLPEYKGLFDIVLNGVIHVYLQLVVELGEVAIFVFGLLMVIQGKMNSKRAGYVTVGFFFFEALQGVGFFIYGRIIIRALIIIPYIMGAVASFFFYIKKDTKPIYKYLIVIASIFGIFRMSYTLYGILMYADHLYSAVYSFRELLTILIYVLFIYQMIVLSIRRKQAVF